MFVRREIHTQGLYVIALPDIFLSLSKNGKFYQWCLKAGKNHQFGVMEEFAPSISRNLITQGILAYTPQNDLAMKIIYRFTRPP